MGPFPLTHPAREDRALNNTRPKSRLLPSEAQIELAQTARRRWGITTHLWGENGTSKTPANVIGVKSPPKRCTPNGLQLRFRPKPFWLYMADKPLQAKNRSRQLITPLHTIWVKEKQLGRCVWNGLALWAVSFWLPKMTPKGRCSKAGHVRFGCLKGCDLSRGPQP